MIVPTALEGRRIVEHAGLVPGEAAMGANIFRDPVAAVRDIVGGQAGACEKVLKDARDTAIGEMTDEAASRGANAAVGVDFDHEVPGDRGSMLMVSANGTAVVVEQGRRLLPRWPQNGTSHRAFRKEPRRVPRIKAEECGPRNGEGSKQGSDIPFTAALLAHLGAVIASVYMPGDLRPIPISNWVNEQRAREAA